MTQRYYGKVSPRLWTGETGKALRRRGTEGLLVAAYLMTAPLSNMLGLYHQPVLYMAHETGLGIEATTKGLRDCVDVGFCSYDEASEFVFVFNMAAWQIAEVLKPGDKRCKGIQKDYARLADNPFLGDWFDRYGAAFHLTDRRAPREGASVAPSKPGAGTGAGTGTVSVAAQPLAGGSSDPPAAATPNPPTATAPKPGRAPKPSKVPAPSAETWNAYAAAYASRYGTQPVRNAKVNGQLAQLVQRLGNEPARLVAAFYVGHEGPRYVGAMHSVDLLLADAEKLHTECMTGRLATGPPLRQSNADRRLATVRGLTTHQQATSHDPRPEPPDASVIVDVTARLVG